MKITGLFSSPLSFRKRVVGVTQSLTKNGFGRTLLKINDKYQFTTYNNARKFIKFCKICSHPIETMKRRKAARQLIKKSPYASLIPQETAYNILPPDTIAGSGKIVAACRELYERSLPELQAQTDKDSFSYLLLDAHTDARDVSLSSNDVYNLRLIPGLTEFVFSPTLIEAASCYLGSTPILAGVTQYVSLPNNTLEGSQLFHVDKGDFRQVKFIFAITDVHEENGPFTFIPADKALRVKKQLGNDFYKRIPDDTVYEAAGNDAAVKLLAPSGSCLIIDTGRCLHYGSRGNKQFRCLLEIQYMSPFNSVEPSFYFSNVKTENLPHHFSHLQKMVLGKMKRI